MPHPRYRTVLFDLDGTLLDTAPDLAHALNTMRRRRGLSDLPDADTRAQASHGSQGLIRLGFGILQNDPAFPALRREFLDLYEASLTDRTIPFPGVAEMLDGLEARGLAWGVVTNKPARYTEPLLRHLHLLERAACVVSGDTCAHPKPHPAPMLHACAETGSAPEHCLYVGDAERDVVAARAAGIPTLVALYGYLGAEDRPDAWGGIGHVHHPAALLDWLDAAA